MNKMLTCLLGLGVSLSVLTSGIAQEKKEEKKRPEPAVVFKRLDKNSDNKVTKEEFMASRKTDEAKANAEKQFTNKDKDKDGSLTLEEFSAKPAGKKPEKKPE